MKLVKFYFYYSYIALSAILYYFTVSSARGNDINTRQLNICRMSYERNTDSIDSYRGEKDESLKVQVRGIL